MSPPRRPKNETPKTTIRFLQRQIANLQASCARYHAAIADKDKVIAGYDAQLSEERDRVAALRRRMADEAIQRGTISAQLRQKSERLAFLEGYYAKSQETAAAARPIYATRASFIGDQPETDARPGARDTENLSARRQGSQSAGIDQGAAGFGPGLGNPLWRQHPHHTPHPQGRPVEHIEVTENGLPRAEYRR